MLVLSAKTGLTEAVLLDNGYLTRGAYRSRRRSRGALAREAAHAASRGARRGRTGASATAGADAGAHASNTFACGRAIRSSAERFARRDDRNARRALRSRRQCRSCARTKRTSRSRPRRAARRLRSKPRICTPVCISPRWARTPSTRMRLAPAASARRATSAIACSKPAYWANCIMR